MTTTPDLGIPELAQAQANPDVTHNEALVLIQALLNGVVDKDLTAPPGSPSEGDAYLINTASPTGAWVNRAYCVAIYWGGSWRFVPGNDNAGSPLAMGSRQEGMRVWVRDENQVYVWRNSSTSPLSYDWVAEGVGPFVSKAGDTMTGALTINRNTGTLSPPADTMQHLVQADGSPSRITLDAFAAASNPQIIGRRSRGSLAAPTAVQTGDTLLSVTGFGYGATAYSAGRAAVQLQANENWTDTAQGGRVSIQASANGAATLVEVARFTGGGGLFIAGAVGNDQGAGTINAVNYFDDGVNINTIYAGLASANTFSNASGQIIVQSGAPSASSVTGGALQLSTTDAGAGGATLNFFHDSASPAVSDVIGQFQAWGRNSSAAALRYGIFRTTILDATAGSEDARIGFFTVAAGALAQRLSIDVGVYTPNATGTDQGADTFNCQALYTNGNVIADTNGLLRGPGFTVGTLPAASGVPGARTRVSDSNAALTAGIGAVVAGGGANVVPVFSDGTNWRIG